MNVKRNVAAAFAAVIFSGLVACTNNDKSSSSGTSTTDTNLTDTRRNADDTTGYMVHDSTNKMNVHPNSQ